MSIAVPHMRMHWTRNNNPGPGRGGYHGELLPVPKGLPPVTATVWFDEGERRWRFSVRCQEVNVVGRSVALDGAKRKASTQASIMRDRSWLWVSRAGKGGGAR